MCKYFEKKMHFFVFFPDFCFIHMAKCRLFLRKIKGSEVLKCY